jgi:hypothetical protein
VTITPDAIDYRALGEPVDPAELRAYRKAARAARQPWARRDAGSIALLIVGIVVCLLVTVSTGGLFFSSLLPVIVVLTIAAVGVRRFVVRAGRWRRWLRLEHFAKANGLSFIPQAPDPGYSGAVFGTGSERIVRDRISRAGSHFFDLGNYDYVTGSGKSRAEHHWGYLALKLDRRLPNMVLDAKSNNGLFGNTNLPETFRRDQRLSLEGDFDRYFTLYCPKEYEADALYVFTPDLMALLIDQSQQFDIEIVDDWMFVYSAKPLRLDDAATLNHLFRIVDTVGTKTIRQTTHYADDRVGNRAIDMVAPQGRRLKTAFPIVAIVFLVAYGAFWVWTALTPD